MDLAVLIKNYLFQVQMMHLSTVHDNKPWVSTVYFAFDANLNLYWLSDKNRRHSKEIEKNSHVAGAIVAPQAYGEKVSGLQFEGEARKLEGVEVEQALNIYRSRYWIVEDRALNKDGQDPHTCYQFVPKLYCLFDEINFPQNPVQILKM